MQRREHVRIRKLRPTSSAVILALLLGAEDRSNPRRSRRCLPLKNQPAGEKLPPARMKVN